MSTPDSVTLQRIQTAHPKLRAELSAIYQEIQAALTGKAVCRFAYVLRTMKEQDDLFAQGRTKPGKKVTNARAGQSAHNYGLAVDIVLLLNNGKTASWDMKTDFDDDKKADWMEVVEIFKKHSWVWGGDWKNLPDAPHFEKTFGKKCFELQAMYNAKKVDKDGYLVL